MPVAARTDADEGDAVYAVEADGMQPIQLLCYRS